jgi:hypothetical protein
MAPDSLWGLRAATVQQRVAEVEGVLDADRHREEIRRLVTAAPDEPTYCEFKKKLSYATPKEKGELVKDVSSFANADLESLGGYGYIVFGISPDGRVVGVGDLSGDPPSETRKIINNHLDRPVVFEYLTCEVNDKAGDTKRVAAIVVPDSRRRPHVVSREIKERLDGRDKFRLREGEVWVRKTGGRELATAEDIDTMYESKLRRLVDEQVRPLTERVEQLERDLREQKAAAPELSFGAAVPGSTDPSPEGRPYPVLGNLISIGWVHEEIEWAKQQAAAKARSAWGSGPTFLGPHADDYEDYGSELKAWLQELEDVLVVDFVLTNTGRVPAEDVEVVLEVPAELWPKGELPERPERPRDYLPSPVSTPRHWRIGLTKQNAPDLLIGPEIHSGGNASIAEVVWEVGKLYHDRPLFTRSDADDVGALLISGRDYREYLSRVGGSVRLDYTVRAANVPEAVRGVVVLR